MGTKTVDGAEPGTGTETAEPVVATAEADGPTKTGTTTAAAENTGRAPEETAAQTDEQTDEQADGQTEGPADGPQGPTGVGQGAAAVVSAGLGLVSLTGGWIGTVASARENLIGQLQTSSSASVAQQVKEIYGDAWHTTALWAGLFAVLALITGVVVLARPAFGTPGRPQAAWIKSVAWAGVSLGVIGLLLAVLKYSDALLALPSTS